MNKSEITLSDAHLSFNLPGAVSMKEARITPLSLMQYVEISDDIYDEIERVVHAGMIAAKCIKHPEYGDIILVSSTHDGCLMIHFQPAF
jgi:hypothetical protein